MTPRFMKLSTLAQWLDVSEPTVRRLEREGKIPKRHPELGTFDSEAVVKALTIRAAGGEDRTDAQEATARLLEDLQRTAQTRRRHRAGL
jgi:hypothetical protein